MLPRTSEFVITTQKALSAYSRLRRILLVAEGFGKYINAFISVYCNPF